MLGPRCAHNLDSSENINNNHDSPQHMCGLESFVGDTVSPMQVPSRLQGWYDLVSDRPRRPPAAAGGVEWSRWRVPLAL